MLFDFPENKLMKAIESNPSIAIDDLDDCFESKFDRFADFKKTLDNLISNAHYTFVSEGRFSGHELLLYLLKSRPKSKIYIATWKISEDPARLIINARTQGLIDELHILVERRMTIKSPNALQLVQYNSNSFGMADCHAKVFVIEHDSFPVSVVMSANFSNNPRIEAGCISTTDSSAKFHVQWIKNHIEKWQQKNI